MADTFDLIVIGAGLNGAGVARDAAMRGLRVLLLDKADLCSATSAWNSRLIHGGLRYLEHGEIGLVRESLRERELQLRLHPHLVRPLRLMIPIYAHSRRGWWTIRAGLIAYDVLSSRGSLPSHRMLQADEALRLAPGLEPRGLRGAAVYHDAQVTFPERLVVENALSAAALGATIRTYCRVEELLRDGRRIIGVRCRDAIDGGDYEARAPLVINVAGPWVDQVLGSLEPRPRRLIGGTRGSHIVVDHFGGAPECALYVEARADRRPIFILPWNGRFLIGTTDLRFEGNPDDARATEAEIEYLLAEVNHVLPGAALGRESVLYSYCGVRPLPFTHGSAEGAITRRHIVHDHAPAIEGLVSIVGGKLTTYRHLAQVAVDAAFTKLGRPAPPCATAHEPLPGAGATGPLPPAFSELTRQHLRSVYGRRAADVATLAVESPHLAHVVDDATGAIAAEIAFARRHEFARTLPDILLRRTMIGLTPPTPSATAPAPGPAERPRPSPATAPAAPDASGG